MIDRPLLEEKTLDGQLLEVLVKLMSMGILQIDLCQRLIETELKVQMYGSRNGLIIAQSMD